MKTFVPCALLVACLAMNAEALFFPVATTGAAAGTVTIAGGSGVAAATALVGGAILLKALALGGLYLASRARGGRRGGHRRGRRDAQEDDYAFGYIADTEPAQCYRRLICDLATGAMPESETDVILSLFKDETPITSPKFEYAIAANLGKITKDVRSCEVRYHCPLSSQEIQKILKQ